MKHHHEFRAEPGIYFLYDKHGLVLYIGKANSLTSFDTISRIIAWPLAIVGSKQAIDCCYDTVDSIKSDQCSPGELDLEEFKHIRSLKPPFNYQFNGEVAESDRWKYFPAKYLKSKALSNVVSHYTRRFAMQTLGEN